MVEQKNSPAAIDISKNLYLLSTGQPVIDLGKIRIGKSDHDYREVLVPYTEAEMRNRKFTKLQKTHHRLVVRAEKVGTLN
jgi:hypothetical protein